MIDMIDERRKLMVKSKGLKRTFGVVVATVLTIAMIPVGGFGIGVVEAEAAVSSGQWVYAGTVSIPGENDEQHTYTVSYNDGDDYSRFTHHEDISSQFTGTSWVDFVGTCEFPGNTIAGGETLNLDIDLGITDQVIEKGGYHDDSAYVCATLGGVTEKKKLDEGNYDGNVIRFENVDDPNRTGGYYSNMVYCEANKDVVNPTYKSFLTYAEKTVTWKAPTANRSGDSMIIWFVDVGTSNKGGAIGWKYNWQPSYPGTSTSNSMFTVNTSYSSSSKGQWVLTSYDVNQKSSYPEDDDITIYVDESSKKVVTNCRHKSEFQNIDYWGYFEAVHAFPQAVIAEGDKVSVNTTMSFLGGFGYVTWDSAFVRANKNVENNSDFYYGYFEYEPQKNSVGVSSDMTQVFTPHTEDLIGTAPEGKEGDTWTLFCGTYRGGTVDFNYKYVPAGSSGGETGGGSDGGSDQGQVSGNIPYNGGAEDGMDYWIEYDPQDNVLTSGYFTSESSVTRSDGTIITPHSGNRFFYTNDLSGGYIGQGLDISSYPTGSTITMMAAIFPSQGLNAYVELYSFDSNLDTTGTSIGQVKNTDDWYMTSITLTKTKTTRYIGAYLCAGDGGNGYDAGTGQECAFDDIVITVDTSTATGGGSDSSDSGYLSKGETFWVTTGSGAGKYKVNGKGTVSMEQPLFEHNKTAYAVPAKVKDNNGKSYKVTAVAANAFSNVKKYMKSLTIGKNVKKIGAKAFYGCSKLKTIKISTTKLTAKSVGKNAFGKTGKKCVAKVPKKKLKAYKKLLKKKGFKGKVMK